MNVCWSCPSVSACGTCNAQDANGTAHTMFALRLWPTHLGVSAVHAGQGLRRVEGLDGFLAVVRRGHLQQQALSSGFDGRGEPWHLRSLLGMHRKLPRAVLSCGRGLGCRVWGFRVLGPGYEGLGFRV